MKALIARVKDLLISPKTEWDIIEAEDIEVLPHAPISIEDIERSSGITSEHVSDFLRRGWVHHG